MRIEGDTKMKGLIRLRGWRALPGCLAFAIDIGKEGDKTKERGKLYFMYDIVMFSG